MTALSLRGLVSADEQTAEWMAAARTPQTRAAIRRWSKVETLSIAVVAAGLALFLFAPFASVAVAIWSRASGTDHGVLHCWIWGTALGVLAAGSVLLAVAGQRRQRACFADGHLAAGTVERAFRHPGSGDDLTWYDLRISAVLPDGTTLRRRLHLEGEHLDRRVGRPVGFRHNTIDPDALDDIQLAGWPDRGGKP
ncbi:hypothetical protein [Tsukamurella tyrosinosolvens]|uniref:hypothetical protein n=1 Tax=Tsukamurella tyrosinosolvens TaxID=57704 RepID=UPI001C6A5331|nr:hypothetical protein [Tsukamurella tyrosinosolvens]